MIGRTTYIVLLVDRKKVMMFTLLDGKAVGEHRELVINDVPQKVRANEQQYYGRSDKIFRHIEDHLHRHLKTIVEEIVAFSKKQSITGIVVGGHKEFFGKIDTHLPQSLSQKVKGTFVTELNAPFNDILHRATVVITDIEKENRE